jgi:type I restriction enzyme S subunit
MSAKDLKEQGIDWDTGKYISPSEHAELTKRCKPECGDVLLAKSGSLGPVAIVDRIAEFSLFESVCLMKLDADQISGEYLISVFRNPSMRNRLMEKNKGIAVKHLHLVDIKSLVVPIPPFELQQAFSQRTAAVQKVKREHRRSLESLDRLFSSLQHRAFRGEMTLSAASQAA